MERRFRLLLLVGLALTVSSCYLGRMAVYNVADVNDYKKSPQLHVGNGSEVFTFFQGHRDLTSELFSAKFIDSDKITDFESLFAETKTTSFLIVKNDSIVYERYFNNYNDSSLFTSFSVNKSFVSALVGIAVSEGKITSVNDPITKYITIFKNEGFDKITIENLLNMESGIDFDENYFNPFAEIGKFYYGRNLKSKVAKLKVKSEPGKEYDYLSVNTLLLAMIVESATGKPLDTYYQEKLWVPLGMEYDATINIDNKKSRVVKGYCCLNARTRDYAKFGRLYLNHGNWNGKQVIPADWIKTSTTYNQTSKEKQSVYYHYQWRIDNHGNFFAQGLLGQFIFINPRTNVIIVRTGKKPGPLYWPNLLAYISAKI